MAGHRSWVLAANLVGQARLVHPAKIAREFVSPRKCTQTTFHLLFGENQQCSVDGSRVEITEEIVEWDYGDYKGMLTPKIKGRRQAKGLDNEKPWDIWKDGCEGEESTEQVTARLDGMIQKIHTVQGPNMHGENPADVVLVAHGHILRAFVMGWLRIPMPNPLGLMMSPGVIGILNYENHSLEEPALMVGMSLPSSP